MAVYSERFILSRKNEAIKLDFKIGEEYANLIFSWKFRKSLKRTNCETNIYLHPGNVRSDPNVYYYDRALGLMINDPFWVDYKITWRNQSWKINYLNSVPKYSLLICEKHQKWSSCYNNDHIKPWINALIDNPNLVRMTDLGLVLQTFPLVQLIDVQSFYKNLGYAVAFLNFIP